jgi:hypothetical protein
MITQLSFSKNPALGTRTIFFLILICCIGLVIPASAYGYSEDFEGYLGETITLHGASYNSDTVYLFMTGPGLSENGVILTNPSRRADQGYFTVIDVNSNQEWSFTWDTMRIKNQIDPGTYTVYVVNAPADKANLDGHSYQTLTVYLKDGDFSGERVSVGAKYTLNLLDDEPATTATTVTTVPLTTPTTVPTTVQPESSTMPVVSTPTTVQKSPLQVYISVFAVLAGVCIRLRQHSRR